MGELIEIKIDETVFKAQKLSGYRLLKVLGGDRDEADAYRDLILACVKEPQLSKEEVEEMDSPVFLKLGTELLKHHMGDLRGFRNFMNLSKK